MPSPVSVESRISRWCSAGSTIPTARPGRPLSRLVESLSDSLSDSDRERALSALSACVKQFGQGLNAIYRVGGSAAIEALVADSDVKLETLGPALLTDAPEVLVEVWADPQGRQSVLGAVLGALESDDWEIRQKAADWLGQNAERIPPAQHDKVVSALEARLHSDDDEDVRESAEKALSKVREHLRTNQIRPREERLQSGDQDAQVEAIRALVNMGTREALRTVIRQWREWIMTGANQPMVENVAEEIHALPLAVPLLVDEVAQVRADSVAAERGDEGERGKLRFRRRLARQLADMSDPRRFAEDAQKQARAIQEELNKYAVPVVARRLPEEDDLEVRENFARTLGNVGGHQAVDALAHAVVAEERTRARRQELLATYYLEPSKAREEEAATILKEAVKEAKRTLRLLQGINIVVIAVGLLVLLVGLFVSFNSEELSARVAGVLVSLGGLSGVIVQLIRSPLERIQNAMGRLVQVETAFTSFIWELNLNGTYIQSQYVARGRLEDAEIAQTAGRIEDAMRATMHLVAAYTDEGKRQMPRIHALFPAAGEPGTTLTVDGEYLHAAGQRSKARGMIAVNHVPMKAPVLSWDEHEVTFVLPSTLEGGTAWVSLLAGGVETNALPFVVWKSPGPQQPAHPAPTTAASNGALQAGVAAPLGTLAQQPGEAPTTGSILDGEVEAGVVTSGAKDPAEER